MRAVASRFAANMDNIISFLEVMAAAVQLGKESIGQNRSRSAFQVAARRLHNTARTNIQGSGRFTLVALDGAFLTACAEFELAVRDLIEAYVLRATLKCPQYSNLPKEMRDWYPEGCARIILRLSTDKFSHLTQDAIVRSLADTSKNRSHGLVCEAFSEHERNFGPDEVDKCFHKRLGIRKVWQKLARDAPFQSAIGTTVSERAEQIARMKLEDLLTKRNNVIHRGRTYYSPSESEVRESVEFLKALIGSTGEIMEACLTAL